MNLELPEKVERILETLAAHGHEAYAVGGCVRDSILGRNPEDWDITTSAKPEEVKAVFPHTVDTGIQHGTVTVLIEKEGFEVTTYRIDGEYEDSRHPKEVIFTGNLIEDLKRRDFTINAMAYNPESGMVDAFDGTGDLEKGIIRCVGIPKERFEEDALRILRGVRFAAQLGFSIEEETAEAMKILAPTLSKISAERIQVELTKLLISKNPSHINLLEKYGIAKVVLQEYHNYSGKQKEKVLDILERLERDGQKDISLRFAAAGFFLSEEEGAALMRRLKFDNHTRKNVERLLRYRNEELNEEPVSVRKALAKMGSDIFYLLIELQKAGGLISPECYTGLHNIAKEIFEKKQCISIKALALTGKDLLDAGIPGGPLIGETLEHLLRKVLENPEYNNRELLLEEAGNQIRQLQEAKE